MSDPQPVPVSPVAPHYVMMPIQETRRNGLGAFGFFLALIGLLIPTGIVSFLGFVISLAAIGRSPRAFAAFGVILGLIGSVIWLVVGIVTLIVALFGALIAVAGAAAMFALTQPEVIEVTSDMVNVAVAAKQYEQEKSHMPSSVGDLKLSRSVTIDPWGTAYELALIDEDPGFDLVSAGEDGEFGTPDDIRLTRLDRFWEDAIEEFEHKAEAFGERLEALDGGAWAGACDARPSSDPAPRTYEAQALEELLKEVSRTADKERADGSGH